MSLDPEAFRGLGPGEIMAVLMVEESVKRGAAAKAAGAACVDCRDTGMNGGTFCGCEAGRVIAEQGFRR